MGVDVVRLVGAREEPHARADDADDGQQADDRERGPLLALPADGHGRHPAARQRPLRHPVEETVGPSPHPAVGRGLGMAGRTLDGCHAAHDGIRQRNRRALRRSGKRVARPDRLEWLSPVGGGYFGGLDYDEAVPTRAAQAARTELPMNLIDRALWMELAYGVLDRPEPDASGHVRRDQDETVAHRDLAVPDLGPVDILVREAALRVGIGESQQPGLPDEVSLGRTKGRDVELVGSDDRQGQPDRRRLTRDDGRTLG